MAARWPKNKVISNDKIKPGNVIVGLSSFGQASYETEYNSGIGSNGLTSARHDVLNKYYAENFPNTFEPSLQQEVVYIGNHRLTDSVEINYRGEVLSTNIGKLILSPTRTYAPVVKQLLEENFDAIHGLIHCSGGGQTKCLKYLPAPMRVIKDNLFQPPTIFNLIQQASKSDFREMYQVFNMGHRLEIFTDESAVQNIIAIAEGFGIEAQVVGRVEESDKKELILKGSFGEIKY
jgi:phosphoribosylformylglycinamidine cyclo-ligase